MKKKQVEKQIEKKESNLVKTSLPSRGRTFEGIVTRKFPKRIAIEFERTIYIQKYERFAKTKTRIHARLPDELADQIQIGDLVQVRECRPLSKIIHFIVVKKIKSAEKKQ
ncbi:30S ribosomal protein S17 [Candidatus Pacearchaeota archaeon]|nr:30S ribosomal protein S17P [uncultured archaeon]MBS3088313.1 30S ribosomal protein S17 [Candidatus Pacearchaeota archaeon]